MNIASQGSDDPSNDSTPESKVDIHEYWIDLLQSMCDGLIEVSPSTDSEFGRITLRKADGCELNYLQINFGSGNLSLFPEDVANQGQRAMGDYFSNTTTLYYDEDILSWTEWRAESRVYEWKDDRGLRITDSNRRILVKKEYCTDWENVRHFGLIYWDTKDS
jgi:hypothetical protein